MVQGSAFARRLIATREALGLRPSQFCEAAGIARSAYSNWEAGENVLVSDSDATVKLTNTPGRSNSTFLISPPLPFKFLVLHFSHRIGEGDTECPLHKAAWKLLVR